MDTVSTVVIANQLYHQWALPGILSIFVVALFQAAYVVLTTKQREVTANYLRIREVLAGTFRTTLLREVRAVFKAVEDHLPSALIRQDPLGEPSRFDLLLKGVNDLDDGDDRSEYERVLYDSLAGVLIRRVDALLVETERATANGEEGSNAASLSISFAETTVDDLVYLARALHLTRKHQARFYSGRKWSRRFLFALVISFAVLVGSMLITPGWGYWLGVAALGFFAMTGLASLAGSSLAVQALIWLEEKAEAPDAEKLIRSELTA